MMTPISGTFVERIKRTDTIESFRFQLEKKLEFAPGQCLKLIFDLQNLHNRELNKFLSFSSAPQASYIEVTKRLSGSMFSERLKQLRHPDAVSFLAPYGQCVFKDEYQKIGFLVGGIGITPVVSILEYIASKNFQVDVCLLYVNRSEHEIAFKDELLRLSKGQRWRVCLTVDDRRPQSSGIRFGCIGPDLVTEVMPDVCERVVFSFGPPMMVKAMKDICPHLGCRSENLKTEIFAGY
ncbi:MAG TPA: FAD-dependent oxidoreductase [Candidatus Omnitrophota bacterium]|nr:FAD-dependent oxidoreductase [Candidatus Omnitrophota bacterium]